MLNNWVQTALNLWKHIIPIQIWLYRSFVQAPAYILGKVIFHVLGEKPVNNCWAINDLHAYHLIYQHHYGLRRKEDMFQKKSYWKYSQTSSVRTPKRHSQGSILQRCQYFRVCGSKIVHILGTKEMPFLQIFLYYGSVRKEKFNCNPNRFITPNNNTEKTLYRVEQLVEC